MNRLIACSLAVASVLFQAAVTLANEPKADYSGVSYMYYTIIAVILGYGVYDTFIKKS